MQGQRSLGNSFSETVDLNQGSSSSNNCPNQPSSWSFAPYPMDIDGSSSSSNPNLQFDGVDTNEKNENPFDNTLVGPSNSQERLSEPLNINLNTEDMETEDTFRYKVHDSACSSDFHSYPPYIPSLHSGFSNSGELSLGFGIGRGVTSDVFPPITITETGESSSRRQGGSVNNDFNFFNSPISRNTARQSSTSNNPSDTFGFRPASNWVRSQDEPMNVRPFYDSQNRLISSPENVGNSASELGFFRNFDRSQLYPRGTFSSAETGFGNRRREHSPPSRIGSSSSEETSVANQGHRRHRHSLRSSMRELPGDDVSGWHGVGADMDGRQRMVSEIRHVLNAMRRRDNSRDEDYTLFDPFINGTPEFLDRHRDMRLDVDNMSYEELLALEERIGDVSTGLSEEAILRSMKQTKHLCLFEGSSSTFEPCSICREDYILGDNVGELDCGHDFHTDCIKQWLTQKNLCPICKLAALDT